VASNSLRERKYHPSEVGHVGEIKRICRWFPRGSRERRRVINRVHDRPAIWHIWWLLYASADVVAIFVRDFKRDFRFLGFLFTILSLSRGGKLTKQFYVDYLGKYFCLFSNEKNTLSLSPLFDVSYASQSRYHTGIFFTLITFLYIIYFSFTLVAK